jgi:anti-sigma-K factor RskA
MSTINDPQPDSPAPDAKSEELVAYLDGELSPDECRQIEERLAGDANFREQLCELDQAWEALDALPSTSPGDDFARTTIEMVTLAAKEEQKQRTTDATATSSHRRRMYAIVGGAAVLSSFLAARWLLPDSNARLINDLPVISQMDLLAQIQDLDFLQQLSKEVPLDKLATDQAAVERQVARLKLASVDSPEARRQWIESLPVEQKADLASQAEQFGRLTSEQRDRLKSLQQQIAAAPDADKLQTTLAAYGQWLNRRTSGEQSGLRGMASGASDDGIRRIRDTLRMDSEQAARRLSETDAKVLKQEMFEIYDEVKDKEDFAKFLRRRERDNPGGRRFEATKEEKALFAASWAMWDTNDIDDKTRKRLKRGLTDEAQNHLTRLEQRGGERGGEHRVKWQLWMWMRDAMQPKRESGELERFFAEELDENQREHLLSLRKDVMEARLEQMYLGSRFGLGGAEWFGNFGEQGRGPGPGGPGWRADGPPLEGPGANRFDPNRRGPGPEGPPGPDGRHRRGPPLDRPPFQGPDGPPPPDAGQQQPN